MADRNDKTIVSVWVDREMHQKLGAAAFMHDTTKSGFLRKLLAQYLSDNESKVRLALNQQIGESQEGER